MGQNEKCSQSATEACCTNWSTQMCHRWISNSIDSLAIGMRYRIEDTQVQTLLFCYPPDLIHEAGRWKSLPAEYPQTCIVRASSRAATIRRTDCRLPTTDKCVSLLLVVRQNPIWPSEEAREKARGNLQLGGL